MFGKSDDVILDFAWLCGFLNRKSFAITTFWRHVGRLKIVIMACGSFNFFSLVFEEKSPYRVGRHVD